MDKRQERELREIEKGKIPARFTEATAKEIQKAKNDFIGLDLPRNYLKALIHSKKAYEVER